MAKYAIFYKNICITKQRLYLNFEIFFYYLLKHFNNVNNNTLDS